MIQETKQNRRIVSWGEYTRSQGQRGLVAVLASALWLATFACTYLIGVCVVQAIAACLRSDDTVIALLLAFWGMFVVAGFLTYCLGLSAKRATQKAWAINPGVPLTRVNTSDLPALDTLIRASQKPMREQEAVLLRAVARETQMGDERQLLRASAGCD